MVGFPYDDLDAWCAAYPTEVLIAQFDKMADGFESALTDLKGAFQSARLKASQRQAAIEEIRVAETAAIHFRSVANQVRFVQARRALEAAKTAGEARPWLEKLEGTLQGEISLARRLHAIQTRDSRIGFEATNHYYYVPTDLAEKVLNCHDLLHRWLPEQKEKWGLEG